MLRRLTGRGALARAEERKPEDTTPTDYGQTLGEERVVTTSGEPLVFRYEDILRAVGRFIDEEQLQDVLIVQTEHGVLVRGMQRPRPGARLVPTFCERLFTKAEIAAILEEGRRRRGTGSKLFQ